MAGFGQYQDYDATGLAELVRKGDTTARELADAAFAAIAALNPELNCVVHDGREAAERTLCAGVPDGPFQGVPFVIKDLIIHASDLPTSMGSRLAQGINAGADTELMARFRKAGLVTVGVTATPEFGFNATTEPVATGPVRNPWNLGHSAGGSSGGSAAAVASGMVPMGSASDGGGSIRIPASCCGLFGLKPTRGRIPTGPDLGDLLNGIAIEFAVTRSVRDAATLLDAVAGPDAGAPSFPPPPARAFAEAVTEAPGRLRMGWTGRTWSGAPVHPECIAAVAQAAKLCGELGHEVVEDAPNLDWDRFFDATLVVWATNLAHMMQAVARATGRPLSEDYLERVSLACCRYGEQQSAVRLLEALSQFNTVTRQVARWFERTDILITPTIAQPPAPIGTLNQNAPLEAEAWTRQTFDYAAFTPLFNTTGQPAMSVPLHWTADGLPVGVQFVAPFGREDLLLRLAGQLEQARPWRDKRPPVRAAA